MAPKIRRLFLRIAIAVIIAAPPVAFLDFVLPHHAVLRIMGTQVKRSGTDSKSATGTRSGAGRDIYYIFAEDIETKKPRVFRNEDTGWAFPWYFKFNSADVQAVAQSIADERGTAAITYYGWRFPLFSLFPNAIKVVRAEPGATPIPWFNIAFFAVIMGATVWVTLTIRSLRKRPHRRPKPK